MTDRTSWPLTQRLGFALIVAVAVAAVGYGAIFAPPSAPPQTAETSADGEALTRGGGHRVINGCTIAQSTSCRNAALWDVDLSGADLSRSDLRSANLSGSDLHDATLTQTNLMGADLSDANLVGADVRGADLRFADLTGADLNSANLDGARFAGTTLPDGSRCTGSVADCGL